MHYNIPSLFIVYVVIIIDASHYLNGSSCRLRTEELPLCMCFRFLLSMVWAYQFFNPRNYQFDTVFLRNAGGFVASYLASSQCTHQYVFWITCKRCVDHVQVKNGRGVFRTESNICMQLFCKRRSIVDDRLSSTHVSGWFGITLYGNNFAYISLYFREYSSSAKI